MKPASASVWFPALLAGVVLLFCTPGGSVGGPVPDALDSAADSCVEILVDGHLEGSGWLADAEGRVVTAGHAVRRKEGRCEILWPGHGRYSARLLGADPSHDIALLATSGMRLPVPFLRLAAEVPANRTPLHLFGMAQFRHQVWIGGQVARREATFNYYSRLQWPTSCFLVAAPAPPGVSGGPWLDDSGRVAGTQSGFINLGSASSGLALVAPPGAIARLLEVRSSIPRATMGCGFEELASQPPGFIRRFPPGFEGIVTIPLEPKGPAELAGLTRESVIQAVDGRAVRQQHEMMEVLLSKRPGQTLALEVWFPDTTAPRRVSLTLGTVPP